MTKASRQVKLPGGEIITRPTVRQVDSSHGALVAELTDSVLVLRLRGGRRGGPSEVAVSFGLVYQRAMADRVVERMRARRKGRKAGRR